MDAAPQTPPPPHPTVVAEFRLEGRACRIIDVTGVIPRHEEGTSSLRPRMVYAPGELAHFDWQGLRLALVAEDAPGARKTTPEAGGHSAATWDLLSRRERQIVQLISMGMLSKQVADRLSISEFTVRSYLKTIYCKLGVRTRGALVFKYAQTFNAASMSAHQS